MLGEKVSTPGLSILSYLWVQRALFVLFLVTTNTDKVHKTYFLNLLVSLPASFIWPASAQYKIKQNSICRGSAAKMAGCSESSCCVPPQHVGLLLAVKQQWHPLCLARNSVACEPRSGEEKCCLCFWFMVGVFVQRLKNVSKFTNLWLQILIK